MKLNKKTIAVSTAALVIAGGTSAFAFFSAQGSGHGDGLVAADSNGAIVLSLDSGALDNAADAPATVKVYAQNTSTRRKLRIANVALDTSYGAGTGITVTGVSDPAACENLFNVTFSPFTAKDLGINQAAPGDWISNATVTPDTTKEQSVCDGGTITLHMLSHSS